jgi:hypothetical protein
VQAWRLGAIRFVSPEEGLALTAPRIKCDVPTGHGGGTDVYFQAQPVRLAATSDAGRHWVTSGAKLPAVPQSTALEQVAAVDGARTWVVTDTGKLLVTGNAGASWSAQSLPLPVMPDPLQPGQLQIRQLCTHYSGFVNRLFVALR